MSYSFSIMIVGGGGKGGNRGGGGGGGVLTPTITNITAGSHTVTVGAGGTTANGGNSVFFGYTAYGGGRGGDFANGAPGGCGGGGGGGDGNPDDYGNGGAGTSGQGSAGGSGSGFGSGGGGGGAGIVMYSDMSTSSCNGGYGNYGKTSSSDISGRGYTYGGGGGGAATYCSPGLGRDGGGDGGMLYNYNGANGTDGRGGGGGGNYGNGGKGVVIIRYNATTLTCTGGDEILTIGSDKVHIFYNTGTFTIPALGKKWNNLTAVKWNNTTISKLNNI